MKSATEILYTAYEHVFALMTNRGYVPAAGHEMVPFEEFEELKESWKTEPSSLWIVFEDGSGEKDADGHVKFVDVGFPGSVNKELSCTIYNHITSGGSREYATRNAHAIIIMTEMTTDAVKELSCLKKQAFTRSNDRLNYRIEIFTVKQMQINPLLHSRQPLSMRLITDEDEKEQLRQTLVAASNDKNTPLADLLPIIYFDNPIAVWFDAYVGDVFYFTRQDNTPYFRIVQPDPMLEVGLKKDPSSKKKSGTSKAKSSFE
jgi:hypothetical protein